MLLIIPTEVPLSKKHLPWLTASLIIVTIASFFAFQMNDEKEQQKVFEYYVQSEQFTRELPYFEKYLLTKSANKHYYNVSEVYTKGPSRLYFMVFDHNFRRYLEQSFKEDSSIDVVEWRLANQEIKALLSQVTFYHYGIKYEDNRPVSLITHLFLHGDLFHLLGNMLVLFLFGFGIERLFGRIKLIIIYLLTGAAGASLFTLLDGTPYTPLLGASGAISGLMGAYIAYYGARKIRFFAWFGLYFNHFQWSALMVLAFWLIKELGYYLWGNQPNVAYLAHLGGLLSGALLGFLLKPRLTARLDEQHSTQNPPTSRYAEALDAIRQLDFDRARSDLLFTLKHHPDHEGCLKSLYNLEKTNTGSEKFKHAVNTLLAVHPRHDQLDEFILTVAQQHLGKHLSVSDLGIEQLFNLLTRQLRNDQVQSSTPHVAMAKKRFAEHPRLPQLLYEWSSALAKREKYRSAANELNYLANYYGETEYGKRAVNSLNEWRSKNIVS
ncbi:rhomboid family intramembrane serine protease [Pleionea litopenaei]|uniref:Rhomboid family intramembrane serine protease n=1 Tax=Pleionea litopenaei TaxID=3070815 RepID=A0AA51RVU2_9GAMM|nr:rhomboid family intramembrane serine protease [Pleionea sp. HL-JVS1]WMS88512.1 rhomboid family intramembrane serine protease [Pleionea sp. HL-JVS1]